MSCHCPSFVSVLISSSAPLASKRVVDLCFVGSESVQTSNLFPNVFLAHGHPDDPNFMNCAIFLSYCRESKQRRIGIKGKDQAIRGQTGGDHSCTLMQMIRSPNCSAIWRLRLKKRESYRINSLPMKHRADQNINIPQKHFT